LALISAGWGSFCMEGGSHAPALTKRSHASPQARPGTPQAPARLAHSKDPPLRTEFRHDQSFFKPQSLISKGRSSSSPVPEGEGTRRPGVAAPRLASVLKTWPTATEEPLCRDQSFLSVSAQCSGKVNILFRSFLRLVRDLRWQNVMS